MISGFLNIIKPTGMTSFEVVSKVKKILGTKKVGHLGTLDPAASGVLPLAVGRATKFFDYFLSKDKEYVALVDFNRETDTLDSFGVEISRSSKSVTSDMIESVLNEFCGEIMQVPPKYSAIKINGERAYDLARKNANFDIKPRKTTIFSIKIVKNLSGNKFLFKVHCSAGTYIRTLFSDMANRLGGVSTTEAIIRIRSGIFKIEDAITLDELEISKNILTIKDVFKNTKIISVSGTDEKNLKNGLQVSIEKFNMARGEEFIIEGSDGMIGYYKESGGKTQQIVYLYEKANDE